VCGARRGSSEFLGGQVGPRRVEGAFSFTNVLALAFPRKYNSRPRPTQRRPRLRGQMLAIVRNDAPSPAGRPQNPEPPRFVHKWPQAAAKMMGPGGRRTYQSRTVDRLALQGEPGAPARPTPPERRIFFSRRGEFWPCFDTAWRWAPFRRSQTTRDTGECTSGFFGMAGLRSGLARSLCITVHGRHQISADSWAKMARRAGGFSADGSRGHAPVPRPVMLTAACCTSERAGPSKPVQASYLVQIHPGPPAVG